MSDNAAEKKESETKVGITNKQLGYLIQFSYSPFYIQQTTRRKKAL